MHLEAEKKRRNIGLSGVQMILKCPFWAILVNKKVTFTAQFQLFIRQQLPSIRLLTLRGTCLRLKESKVQLFR